MVKRDWRWAGLAACLAAVIGHGAQARAGEAPAATDIAAKMSGVVENLGQQKTGEPVQTEQKAIVRDLDDLIASLEKECQNCRGNRSKNNPKKGMDDSKIKSGTGGIGNLVAPMDSGKDWGALSERERDRILQSMSEGFPPEYRTVLERYYRRLAEEKTTKGSAKVKAEATPEAPAQP